MADQDDHFELSMNNFTPRAQQVLVLAKREAKRFGHNYVGTEHLLLGLIKLGQGVAVAALQAMGLDLETVRYEVEKHSGPGSNTQMEGDPPLTPRVKRVLSLAAKEARALNYNYIGTEHLLLGLLREGDGVAARILKNLNVDADAVRNEVMKALDPNYLPSDAKGEAAAAALRAAGHDAICFANSANKGVQAPRAPSWDAVYALIKQRHPTPGEAGEGA